jgi:hypothetical protein
MSSGQRGGSDVVEFVLFYKGDPLIRSTDRLEVERCAEQMGRYNIGNAIEIKRMIGGLRDA